MKAFLLLVFPFCLALAPVSGAESPAPVQAPKSKPKASQPAPRVAPAVAPKTQRHVPPSAVPPKVHRSQPPVSQQNVPRVQPNPYAQPKPRVPAYSDAPRPNKKTPAVSGTFPSYAQPDMIPQPRPENTNVPKPIQKAPPVSATVPPYAQPDMVPHAIPRNRDLANDRDRDSRRPRNDNEWRDRGRPRVTWHEACRRHPRHHHHRDWWRNHFTRFALFGTGYYFWDAGYWYPAYGYDLGYNTYVYQEPIYSYDDLEPGQVVANVQTELQQLGYYRYAVDGLMGPETRAAIAAYQGDYGLEITSAIDEPTLASLGLLE